jgi:cell division protein YceG involved in septum cleavage
MKKVISTIFGFGANIIIYAVAIFILFRVGAFAYDFSYEVFGEPVVSQYSDEEVRIEIQSGDGSQTVAKKLKDAGVINSEWAFILKSRLSKADLMPGTYIVKASMSADDMIELMGDAANSVVQQKTADELAAEAETSESMEEGEDGQ